MDYLVERGNVCGELRALFTAGVMPHSGHANASVRLPDERMLLTSVGHVRDLRTDQFAVVGLDGVVLEGELTSTSSEIVEMHAAIYRAASEVGAVLHTHPRHATAFALAHKPIPARYEPLLRFGQAFEIPVVAWAPRGSAASVDAIADIAARRPGVHAVLMANHGVTVYHRDIGTAAGLMTTVEEAAEVELGAGLLGGGVDLPEEAFDRIRRAVL